MDACTPFRIILLLSLCFYKSCIAQGGDFDDLLMNPGGELPPSQRAENTAKEFRDIDENLEICGRNVLGCYPGVLTSPGKNFTEKCVENTTGVNVKDACDGDSVGQDLEQGKDPPAGPSAEDEIFLWRCDFTTKSCCRTCRRTTPMVIPIPGDNGMAYPVFCPVDGGFQLKDDIACVQQGCRKPCEKAFTLYSFLVTSVPPDGLNGHCDQKFLPVWFTSVKMDTHCVCPKEGKRG